MSQKKNKKILILGGAGFLGNNLIRRCLREPDTLITVVDSLDPVFKSTTENFDDIRDAINFIQGDLRDEDLLSQVVPGIDIVFNCAAQSSHPMSLARPVFDAEINCLGNLHLLEAVRKLNPKAVVVYPSSSTLIGRAIGDIIDESHGEKPLDIYSANKGVAEKYYRIYHRVHDIQTVVLRFANLFGPYGKYDPTFGFVNYFIHRSLDGKKIKIFGDGTQTRNVMFVDDATDIMWLAAHSPQLYGDSYFAVHHDHHTVKDIAEAIVETLGGEIEYVPWPDVRKRIEIEKVRISSAKLHYATDWKPKYSLHEGLKATKMRLKK